MTIVFSASPVSSEASRSRPTYASNPSTLAAYVESARICRRTTRRVRLRSQGKNSPVARAGTRSSPGCRTWPSHVRIVSGRAWMGAGSL